MNKRETADYIAGMINMYGDDSNDESADGQQISIKTEAIEKLKLVANLLFVKGKANVDFDYLGMSEEMREAIRILESE